MLAIAVRVIMQRPAPGVALAWLLLTASLPFGGAVIYFLIGERRIGARRELGVRRLRAAFESIDELESRQGFADIDWSRHPPAARGLDSLGRRAVGSATLRGSGLQLFADTQETFRAIGRDVEAAKKSLLMEFYIWQEGGAADDLLEAVIRAARRGVSCRLLVDALGARPWWRGGQPRGFAGAGGELRPRLPGGPLRAVVCRIHLALVSRIYAVVA